MSARIRVLSCSGLVLVGLLSLTGCYARGRVEPAYVETTYVPARVDVYPSYYYEGRTVYLIDGRWYYRRPSGAWVYYRREPPALYRQRMTIRRAPPAPLRPAYRESAPRRPGDYRDGRRPPPRRPGHDDRDRDRDRRDDRRRDDRYRY